MDNHQEDDHEFLGGMGGLQTMGILNALRTGDPTLDMVLAMSLPFVLRVLFDVARRLQDRLGLYLDLWSNHNSSRIHERTIEQSTTKDCYGYTSRDETDTQNTILIKAIELYLHAVVKLPLKEADIDLTSTEDKNASIGRRSHSYYGYDSDDDDSENDSKTVVGALSKYKIIQKVRPGRWHDLGKYGDKLEPKTVKLMIVREERENGDQNNTQTKVKRCFRFQSDAGEAVDDFIEKAYQWYVSELKKLEDNARYLYELKASTSSSGDSDDGDEGGSRSGILYTRYKLSDEKTFRSLFFKEKPSLLRVINHFQQRKGKYAIEGYPHKLGILLHGEPGCGKTSLIKALAQYTGRSIVNVPLARVSTNAELMSIFFDRKKWVQGESVPVKLGFKDVIFVMEDVDAASKIVKRRGRGKAETTSLEADQVDMPLPKSLWHMLLESDDNDCKELVKQLLEKSDELKLEANKPHVVAAVAQRATALPGLSLVGDATSDRQLESIRKDTLRAADNIMQGQDTVDRFLSRHARVLITMIENGAAIDQSLVDELLGKMPLRRIARAAMAREESGASATGEVAENATEEIALARILEMTTEVSKSGEDKSDAALIGPKPSLWSKPDKDELNLSGLLNVLDGVVDSPGRIVIMTTNHVEHLDPALIRPGRIDKRLLLGAMGPQEVVAMLEHYFQQSLDETQRTRVNKAMGAGGASLTPAQVEQLMAEYDGVNGMIGALEVAKEGKSD